MVPTAFVLQDTGNCVTRTVQAPETGAGNVHFVGAEMQNATQLFVSANANAFLTIANLHQALVARCELRQICRVKGHAGLS